MSRNTSMLPLLLTGTLLSLTLAISIEDCPPNLHRDRYLQVRGNLCYTFMTYKSLDFEDAERDCHSHKGKLATVGDKDTQTYLYTMLKNTYHVSDPVWVGLSDENDEGEWEWMDGTKASYTNWADGQPGIGSALENCAAINMGDHGKWHDYRCNDLLFIGFDHPYVCEYGPFNVNTMPATATTTTTKTTPTTTVPTTQTMATKTTPTTTSTTPTTTTTTPTTVTITHTTTSTTTTPTTTTTTTPTTTTTTPTTTTTTTPTTTTTTPTTVTTTTPTTTAAATCPPFVCPDLSCGLDGYKRGPDGCTLCECDV